MGPRKLCINGFYPLPKDFNNSLHGDTASELNPQIVPQPIDAKDLFPKKKKLHSRWNSLITYSQVAGLRANGFIVSYRGYKSRPSGNWMFQLLISTERFDIYSSHFSQFNYQEAKLQYWMLGFGSLNNFSGNFHVGLDFVLPFGN